MIKVHINHVGGYQIGAPVMMGAVPNAGDTWLHLGIRYAVVYREFQTICETDHTTGLLVDTVLVNLYVVQR